MADKVIPIPDFYTGNIDLNNRQVYVPPSKDYIQTEYSTGISFDPGDTYSISVPRIVDGQKISEDAARAHFLATGEHLGLSERAPNESPADFYNRVGQQDNALHERQAEYYLRGPGLEQAKGLGYIPPVEKPNK